MRKTLALVMASGLSLLACSDKAAMPDAAAGGQGGAAAGTGGGNGGNSAAGGNTPIPLPAASCMASGGGEQVAAPRVIGMLGDRWHEAWLGSPAVADLDADGTNEIIVPRDNLLLVWHLDGTVVRRLQTSGRIWAPPVVADLRRDLPGLEVAVASRGRIHAWDATGTPVPGFPFEWRDEMRSLAASDIDGDGQLELVAATTGRLDQGGRTDILIAVNHDGTMAAGFPPNTTGASGCDDACYVHSAYDQNVALGDVNNDGVADVLAPQDNAYVSLHEGNGRAFDAAAIFKNPTKFLGVRFLHDYAAAQQGYADNEATANQAHFTNTAPIIWDVDGDGTNEIVMLGSVQNAAQTDRERGVALWVVNHDGTRPAKWLTPFHASGFLDGLWDPGDNIVAMTNQVTPVDLDPARAGAEFVFAGFDGRIHAVTADNTELWQQAFTQAAGVLTGGVVAADLSRDGRPELIFNTYSSAGNGGALFILGAGGALLHKIPLPGRGAMPVPTVHDVDGDGDLEIVVSLKDNEDRAPQVLVYTVDGSGTNCLPWPTGRGNLLRSATGKLPRL